MNDPTTTTPTDILPTPPCRRRWLTALVGVLIFAAGFICGGGVTIVAAVHRLQYAIHHPEEAPARIATQLQRKLRLSDTQKTKVEQIVTQHQVQIAAIRHEFQPQVVVQLEQIRNEIAEQLDDSQRARWTKMFDDLRDRWLPAAP